MDSWDIGMLNFLAFLFWSLHVISMFADTSDKLIWDFHVIAKSSHEKVVIYLKKYKYRSGLLRKDSRTGCGTQAQSVMGMFIKYDASKSLQTNCSPERKRQ
jgi:hypothetical protein